MRRRMLSPAVLEGNAPRTAALARTLRARGFGVYLFDVTPAPKTPGAVGLPVAAAVLVDEEQGPVPLTAGYACALGRDEALLRALLEAAQSRLTDIHGAREDVSSADQGAARDFAAACASVRPKRQPEDLPDFSTDSASPARALRRVLEQLRRGGFTQAAAVALDAPVPGLHIQRVVVPGMRISELL